LLNNLRQTGELLRESFMPMPAAELEAQLRAAFPDAEISIVDLAGDGDHYRARIVSPAFRGLTRVKQHQLVYAALGGKMGGELHALALETAPTPEG
jgi:stress-induced morphogen